MAKIESAREYVEVALTDGNSPMIILDFTDDSTRENAYEFRFHLAPNDARELARELETAADEADGIAADADSDDSDDDFGCDFGGEA